MQFILDILFPKFCFYCETEGSYLCSDCAQKLPQLETQYCIVCGQPSSAGLTHAHCKTDQTPDQLLSGFHYKHPIMQDLIISGKYSFIKAIYQTLGTLLAESPIFVHLDSHNAVLCPIPLHSNRLRWRGFNQSEVIAQELSSAWNTPVLLLLQRTKQTKTQKDLSQEARTENMQEVFAYASLNNTLPHTVILIDDVCTTGSTLLSAAKVLKQNAVQKVICLTLARD